MMLKPKKYTKEQIDTILSDLRTIYPDLTFSLYTADNRFIRASKVLREMRVDTISVPLTHIEYLHLSEAEALTKPVKKFNLFQFLKNLVK